jgi:glutathione S-transferase/uncharacterized OsmC-like protein
MRAWHPSLGGACVEQSPCPTTRNWSVIAQPPRRHRTRHRARHRRRRVGGTGLVDRADHAEMPLRLDCHANDGWSVERAELVDDRAAYRQRVGPTQWVGLTFQGQHDVAFKGRVDGTDVDRKRKEGEAAILPSKRCGRLLLRRRGSHRRPPPGTHAAHAGGVTRSPRASSRRRGSLGRSHVSGSTADGDVVKNERIPLLPPNQSAPVSEPTLTASPTSGNSEDTHDVRRVQREVREQYAQDPSLSRATLRASSRRHPDSDSPFLTVVQARDTVIQSAAHEAISVSYPFPCSGELLLSALAGCGQQSIQVIANAMGIKIRKSEVYVEGDLDFRGTLGISRETAVGFTALRVRYEIDAPEATPEQLAALKAKVHRYCIIEQTMRNTPTLDTEWIEGSNIATLHQFVFSVSSEKVRRCLHHKGIRWRSVEVDWFDRTKLRALTGQTLVPILEHAGKLVGPDSWSVIEYIEHTFDGPTLFPGDSLAVARRINELVEQKLFSLATRGFFPHAAREMNSPRFDADVVRITKYQPHELQGMLADTAALYVREIEFIDDILSRKPWIAGEDCSAADHIFFANYWFATNNPEFRAKVEGFKLTNIQQWASKMREDYLTRIPF